jgi:hypothetical protein
MNGPPTGDFHSIYNAPMLGAHNDGGAYGLQPPLTAGVRPVNGAGIRMNATSILDVVGGLFLLIFVLQVVATVKAHRGLSGKAFRQMTRVSLGGAKALLLICGLGGLASSALQPFLSDWIPPFSPLLVIGGSLLALNAACLPPTFLFLAASKEGGFSLASELQFAVPPLKMVHLLDSFSAGSVLGESLHPSEYRVASDWQRAVRSLAAISPVIIVDVRNLTPNVHREVIHLVEAGMHNKAFLVAESAQAPAEVSRLCAQSGARICVVTPHLLRLALGGVGWTVLFRSPGGVYRLLELKMQNIAQASSR